MKPKAPYDRDALMRLLESLTPGGSEFYENPENCVEWIQRRLASSFDLLLKAHIRIRDLEKQLAEN